MVGGGSNRTMAFFLRLGEAALLQTGSRNVRTPGLTGMTMPHRHGKIRRREAPSSVVLLVAAGSFLFDGVTITCYTKARRPI